MKNTKNKPRPTTKNSLSTSHIPKQAASTGASFGKTRQHTSRPIRPKAKPDQGKARAQRNEPSCKFRAFPAACGLPNCKQRSLRVNSVLSCAKVYKAINRRGTPAAHFRRTFKQNQRGTHAPLPNQRVRRFPPSISLSPMPSRRSEAPSCSSAAPFGGGIAGIEDIVPTFAPSWSHTTPEIISLRN